MMSMRDILSGIHVHSKSQETRWEVTLIDSNNKKYMVPVRLPGGHLSLLAPNFEEMDCAYGENCFVPKTRNLR
jgi:hypothetical protein